MEIKVQSKDDNSITLALESPSRLLSPHSGKLGELLLELAPKEPATVILDMKKVDHIDSTGLSAFVTINRLLRKRGQAFRLRGISSAVRLLLELTRLHQVLDIEPEAQAA